MNNAEKKKINWLKVLRPIALALVLVFLLSYATYAWMKRDWTPSVSQDNVKIVAGSSLTFMYKGSEYEDAKLNELIGDLDFTYKSVSCATGKSEDFYALEYSTKGPLEDTLKKLVLNEGSDSTQNLDMQYTQLGKDNGYIDITFHIKSDEEGSIHDQAVYLHKDSYIRAAESYYENGQVHTYSEDELKLHQQAAKAMRISITTYRDNGTEESTVIYAHDECIQHTGITSQYVDGIGYVAHGAKLYNSNGDPATEVKHLIDGNSVPYPLKENRSVSKLSDAGDTPLFVIKPGETRAITVRIWLEGEDPSCKDEIAGSALDILIKFSAEPAA